MNEYIDLYCERLAPGLWAEPINALRNVAFFVAAFFAYITAGKYECLNWKSSILIFLLFYIGVGSTLFHSFATVLTLYMDVLPILFYQLAFIGLFSSSVIMLGWRHISALYLAFITLTILCEQIPVSVMNGSLSYAPSILFIFGFGVWHYRNSEKEPFLLLGAACLFLLSILFRSLDMIVCSKFSLGTHFIWHMLNGCVLYCTTRSYIINDKP